MGRIQLESEAALAIMHELTNLNQQQFDLFARMNGYIDTANAAWDGALADACKTRQASIKLDTGAITEMFNQYLGALDSGIQFLINAEKAVALKMSVAGSAILANLALTDYTTANISYRGGYKGQCTWYAYGRFQELTGVSLPTARHAKYWLEENRNFDQVTVTDGAENIVYPSIAVATSGGGGNGHVMIIEHVEVDESGNPINVFFTEANNSAVKPDGKAQVLPYDEFIAKKKPVGYISQKI